MAATLDMNGQDIQERALFFERQIILPDDLKQDQKYFLSRLRRDNRVFHGYGVKSWPDFVSLNVKRIGQAEAAQLSTQLSADADDLQKHWLHVTPGLALTPKGDVIFLLTDVYVNTAQENAKGKLVTNQSQPVCEALAARGRHGDYVLVVEASVDETAPVRTTSGCKDQFQSTRLKDSVLFSLIQKDQAKPCAYGTKSDEKKNQLAGTVERDYVRLGLITFAADATCGPKVDLCEQRDHLGKPCEKIVPCKEPDASWIWLWLTVGVIVLLIVAVVLALSPRKKSEYEPTKIDPPLPPSLPLFRLHNSGSDLLQFGRYETIHVVPKTKPIHVDGHLHEWLPESRVHSKLPAPYDDFYSFEGYLMMDCDHLYIAAHVRDPFPLLNKADPLYPPWENGFIHDVYKGGSVTLHLYAKPGSVDPKDHHSMIRIEMWQWSDHAEKPTREPIAGLQIYRRDAYEKGRQKQQAAACFMASAMQYLPNPSWNAPWNVAAMYDTMKLMDTDVIHQSKDDRGVFQLTKHGYTMEYKIRWKSLGMPAPQTGDQHAALFDVHWSDPTGTKCTARLAEVVNGEAARKAELFKLTCDCPELWGQAIFHHP